jgi:phospholipid/cholesterol/gamma-HCH transport system substrate-binding protein
MKIPNEVKVGATALVTILIFIWLYNFLKGKDLLSTTNNYYAVYNQINGLAESSPVEINGYKVGVVQSIDFVNDGTGRLVVKLSVEKGFKLPQKTVAEVTTASLLGGMKVRLLFGAGPGYFNNGDTIQSTVAESIVNKLGDELEPMKQKLSGLVTKLDSVLSGLNEVLTPEFGKNLNGTVSNLNQFSGKLDNLMTTEAGDLKSMLSDLSKFSKTLSQNSGRLDTTLTNLKNISDSLANANLYTAISNLKSTLERTSQLMDGLNKGKGTAGQLVTNDSLYINLNDAVASLDLLLKDVKANPKRYVHFSLFGKKNQPAK